MAQALSPAELATLSTRTLAHYNGAAEAFLAPTQELARVLLELRDSLLPQGVLFSSNPHGPDSEGYSGERYGAPIIRWRPGVT